MEAYTALIQALHHMKRDLEISIVAEIEGRKTDTDFYKEWHQRHAAAWDEVRRQIDMGEFLYSPQSMKILTELNAATADDPNDDYMDHLEKLEAAVLKCLPAIKAAARQDLGLPPLKL